MSEIVRELRQYANDCSACGQFTTAEKLLHAADWIEVQDQTIKEQKLTIAELRKIAGDKVAAPRGLTHRARA